MGSPKLARDAERTSRMVVVRPPAFAGAGFETRLAGAPQDERFSLCRSHSDVIVISGIAER
jgi:hypothetical protein